MIIRNVRAYAPKDLGVTDIWIDQGIIREIGHNLLYSNCEQIDGEGLIAIPGVIETHAHMLLPFGGTRTMNDFYDGTRAGAYGGVTTLIDFADQTKGAPILDAVKNRMEQAGGKCAVDYGFHCTLTDINEETLQAIPVLIQNGFTSFKFYTTYSQNGLYVSYEDMERAFRVIADHGAIATVHAENEAMIDEATKRLVDQGKTAWRYFPQSKPAESESSAVEELIQLAKKTGVRLLIRHVSSAKGAEKIAQAQQDGLEVYGETCPHYLYFDESVYARENGADYIVHPPIRRPEDRQAIWSALENGVKFTIGTDDCAFYLRQKRVSDRFFEVPGGMPGIETRLSVLYELGVLKKRISIERLVELTARTPAKLYGLYPRKGCLKVGSDGDIVLLRPGVEDTLTARKLHEKSDYTPFEGLKIHTRVETTISKGKVVIDRGGRDRTVPGNGIFIKRELSASAMCK